MVSPDESNSDNAILSEWKAARDVLARFDDNLHDLEKYGFSFIAGLLTVDALLGNIGYRFKLAALIGTLALIVVLDVVDRNYRVYLQGANQRATLLENRSGPELTKTIARTYAEARTREAFRLVYRGLAIITFVLGLLVLPLSFLYQLPNLIALLAALFLFWIIDESLYLRPWVYFEVDGFKYKKPSEVLVVLTHFASLPEKTLLTKFRASIFGKKPDKKHDEKSITLLNDVWGVYQEDGTEVPGKRYGNRGLLKKEIKIQAGGDYRWTFSTKDLDPGLYRVVYKGPVYPSRKHGFKLMPIKDNTNVVSSRRWDYAARFWVVK